MDPPMYLQFTPLNALPQESKLVTYMSHNSSTPTRAINQALGKLSLDSPVQVFIQDFPVNYYAPVALVPESPESSPPEAVLSVSNQQVHQENVGGTTYFYSTNESLNTSGAHNSSASLGGSDCMGAGATYAPQMYQSQQTHNMTPMSSKQGPIMAADPRLFQPNCAGIEPAVYYNPWSATGTPQGLAPMFYMPDGIRSEIFQRNEDFYMQPDARQYPDLPENLEMYSELIPLEGIAPHSIATSFRSTHRQNCENYALRRLHSYGTVPSKRFELWKQIDHPNIIRLNECFTTKAFGDHSMILVYDFHQSAVTLMNKYLACGSGNVNDSNGTYHDPFSSDPDAPRPYTHQKNAMLRAVACGALLPEAVLWSILVQLTAGMRAIHAAGLACRTLDPTKVVMTGCRIRISWCGVADALHANEIDMNQAQQEDLTALGRLALSLACRTIHCDNLVASIDLVNRSYSQDLKNLILYLLSSQRRSVTDLMPMIGARFYTQIEALERRADVFENQLARELDNGRLLRIMFKLCSINERPELNMDLTWSETGDRYLLKLFRDYLFHSVTPDGRPWMDQAHIVYCLNQLDSGSTNKVELMTRNEQSVLVVTYAELKHCLEQSFDEMMQ